MKGPPYRKQHYMDLLALLYEVFQKTQRDGLLSIEADVDNPTRANCSASTLGAQRPRSAAFPLRLPAADGRREHEPFELENLMDVELETHHQEAELPAHAVNRVADALPGFGIIAALLGIVIAMGEIDGPVQQIGSLVAAALIGTFIGILAGYSLVGPLGIAMEHRAREKAKYLEVIKVTIMAVLNGYKPVVAVEFGRKAMYEAERPSFEELENHVKGHNA